MVLKKIGMISLAKISAVIYAFLGLVVGLFIAAAVALGAMAGSMFSDSLSPLLGIAFGIGAIILCPIFYGVLGFLAGLIGAALYNWVAGYTGGIELELE
jgi:hypothetical protein